MGGPTELDRKVPAANSKHLFSLVPGARGNGIIGGIGAFIAVDGAAGVEAIGGGMHDIAASDAESKGRATEEKIEEPRSAVESGSSGQHK